MQVKAFIKDLAFVQVVNFLVKPLWILAVDRYVQNQVGEVAYGQYYLAFNLSAVLLIITDLGLNNYLTREGVDKQMGSLSVVRSSARLKIVLSVVFFGLLVILGLQRGVRLDFLVWVGINQVLLSVSQWLRVWLNIQKKFRKESLIAITDRLVAIVLWLGIVVLTVVDQPQMIYYFLGVQTVGLLMAVTIAFRQVIADKRDHQSQQGLSIREVVLSCLPYTLLAFFMAAYTRIDVLLMDALLPDADYHIGVYAQGYRILDAFNVFAALFGTMLLPIFTQQLKSGENVRGIMRTSTLLLAIAGLVLGVVVCFFGQELYQLLYSSGPDSRGDLAYRVNTFQRVVLTFIPIALIYVFGTYITALGKLKFLVGLAIITLGINIGLNLALQANYKAEGAALSALISPSFFCIKSG